MLYACITVDDYEIYLLNYMVIHIYIRIYIKDFNRNAAKWKWFIINFLLTTYYFRQRVRGRGPGMQQQWGRRRRAL